MVWMSNTSDSSLSCKFKHLLLIKSTLLTIFAFLQRIRLELDLTGLKKKCVHFSDLTAEHQIQREKHFYEQTFFWSTPAPTDFYHYWGCLLTGRSFFLLQKYRYDDKPFCVHDEWRNLACVSRKLKLVRHTCFPLDWFRNGTQICLLSIPWEETH